MPKKSYFGFSKQEDHKKEFREAFNAYDWNHSGKISYGNLQVREFTVATGHLMTITQAAMRRCGHNPTDIEVADIINKGGSI